MEKRNVAGLESLKWAVVDKLSNTVVSLHRWPDAANLSLESLPNAQDFEAVELLDIVGYKRN